MNKIGVIHADIKDANILAKVDGSNVHSRLIDWGVSFTFDPTSGRNPIASRMASVSYQYNIPPSVLLFSSEFYRHYAKWAKSKTISLQDSLVAFVIEELEENKGHAGMLKAILMYVVGIPFSAPKTGESKYKNQAKYIARYLRHIVEQFIPKNAVSETEVARSVLQYYNKVFLYTVDVWGFVSIYIGLALELAEQMQSGHLAGNYKAFVAQNQKLFAHMTAISHKVPDMKNLLPIIDDMPQIVQQWPEY